MPDDSASGRAAHADSRRCGTAEHLLPMVQYVADAMTWVVAIPLAAVVTSRSSGGVAQLAALTAVAVGGQLGVGLALGLYRRSWRYAFFDELKALVPTDAIIGGALALLTLTPAFAEVAGGLPVVAAMIALLLAFAVRYVSRLREERWHRPSADGAQAMIVFGAGDGGSQALRQILRNPTSRYAPVALLDDDPRKRRLRLHGVRVEGTLDDLGGVAARTEAEILLVAIPSATSELLRHAAEAAASAGLAVYVLPPVEELFGVVTLGDIRPLVEADLLGRHQADIDLDAVASYISGRRVLVTGAGGSIGSELCRQLFVLRPSALVMFDRDETGLHDVQLSIDGRGLLQDPNVVLGDLRDAERLDEVFREHRPEVVFHAAALKHLPLLEATPVEAWKTNVLGTQNVLEAALVHGISRLVNISTDKAADPSSVLGFSKRVTERLTAHAALTSRRSYVSVRFGNVLGSRGSMLGTFRAQIDAGGPVTVTDPDVTRYFMTVEEAVRLTIQAGAIGRPGEVLVLDMGDPVRILDVAQRLIAQDRWPVEIVFTGLRPGEKVHEALFAADEVDVRPIHPLVSQVPVPPLSIAEATDAFTGAGGPRAGLEAAVRAALVEAAVARPLRRELPAPLDPLL